jgi:hypothetical protein
VSQQNRNRAQTPATPAPPADPPTSPVQPDPPVADVPSTPTVTTADTAALSGAPTAPEAKPKRRARVVVSEGVADDLRRLRKVTDPGTGYELRVGDDGEVTAHHRGTGDPADVEVIAPVIA